MSGLECRAWYVGVVTCKYVLLMGCCILWLHSLRLVVYEDEESAEVALRKLANSELDTRKLYLRKVGWPAGWLAG